MGRVLLVRLAHAALVVCVVVTLCFALIRLAPGDPFFTALDFPGVPSDAADAMRARFGYDRPLPEQFGRFVSGLLRGDLGWSHSRGEPVADAIAALLPNTVLLMGTALLLGGLAGIALGAWQGWCAESPLSRWSDRAGLVVLSVPEFVLALCLALAFGSVWALFPTTGMRSDLPPGGVAGLVDVAHHLVLPAASLAAVVTAIIARHQRAAMHEVRDAEFIRAARASGIPEGRIVLRHALRNALVPVLTVLGVLLASLASGAVVVERVFAWPGMGRAIVEAVHYRDYPLVAGGVLVTSLGVVAATLLADLAVAWADPRLRRRL